VYLSSSVRRLFSWLPLDVSIEQVAALSSQNELPEPSLDLDSLAPSTSSFAPNPNYNNSTIRSPAPSYSTDDPWNTNSNQRFVSAPSNMSGFEGPARPSMNVPPSLAGSGLPNEWWKKQESVTVTIQGQQGFILNRYTVYQITTDVRSISSLLVQGSLSP
jgi:sorting nexin-8